MALGPQVGSSAGGAPGWTLNRLTGEPARKMREHQDGRLTGLRLDRYSWWVAWREVAEYILPRRYRWLVTPNEYNRGSPINQAIIDPTAGLGVRICAAGMLEGVTSRSRPWLNLTIPDFDAADSSPARLWLDECGKRVLRVMASSNYYSAKHMQLTDLCVFGTGPMIIHEDYKNVINCTVPCAGEYFVAVSPTGVVDTLYREITQTVSQLVAEFGLDKPWGRVEPLHYTEEIEIERVRQPMVSFPHWVAEDAPTEADAYPYAD